MLELPSYLPALTVSVAGKNIEKVVLNRLQPLSESIIPETQCGFRPGQDSIMEPIFSVRQMQEKYGEQ